MRPRRVSEVDTDIMHGCIPQAYINDNPCRELIKAQVDRMLKLEVIEPSQGEWASPFVLIPKPEGSPRF